MQCYIDTSVYIDPLPQGSYVLTGWFLNRLFFPKKKASCCVNFFEQFFLRLFLNWWRSFRSTVEICRQIWYRDDRFFCKQVTCSSSEKFHTNKQKTPILCVSINSHSYSVQNRKICTYMWVV